MTKPYTVNRILAGTSHILRDARAELTLERIYTDSQVASDQANARWAPGSAATDETVGDFGFSLRPSQGEFMYLACVAIGAHRVVDFSTSAGASTIYLAAAVRANGGGTVYSADWRPDRVALARDNVTEAGLAEVVDIREGEPGDALADVSGPIDFVWVDGWPKLSAPSRALSVLRRIEPALRPGALVLNDAREPDYVAWVRDPANGFTTSLSELGVLSVYRLAEEPR